ncbi:hypothetical protein CYMTET_26850, partial [Cymbomonas tetramitiformis]
MPRKYFWGPPPPSLKFGSASQGKLQLSCKLPADFFSVRSQDRDSTPPDLAASRPVAYASQRQEATVGKNVDGNFEDLNPISESGDFGAGSTGGTTLRSTVPEGRVVPSEWAAMGSPSPFSRSEKSEGLLTDDRVVTRPCESGTLPTRAEEQGPPVAERAQTSGTRSTPKPDEGRLYTREAPTVSRCDTASLTLLRARHQVNYGDVLVLEDHCDGHLTSSSEARRSNVTSERPQPPASSYHASVATLPSKSTARQPRPQKVQKLAAPAPSAAATSDAALRRSTPEGGDGGAGSTSGTKRQHSEGAMPIPASKRLCQLANADVCVEGQQQKQRGGKKKRGKGKGSKDQAKTPARRTPLVPKQKKPPCNYFLRGACRKGSECEFPHTGTPRTKNEVCRFWRNNPLECRKGDDCPYAHTFKVEPCKVGLSFTSSALAGQPLRGLLWLGFLQVGWALERVCVHGK